jgi:hypothetical protein
VGSKLGQKRYALVWVIMGILKIRTGQKSQTHENKHHSQAKVLENTSGYFQSINVTSWWLKTKVWWRNEGSVLKPVNPKKDSVLGCVVGRDMVWKEPSRHAMGLLTLLTDEMTACRRFHEMSITTHEGPHMGMCPPLVACRDGARGIPSRYTRASNDRLLFMKHGRNNLAT